MGGKACSATDADDVTQCLVDTCAAVADITTICTAATHVAKPNLNTIACTANGCSSDSGLCCDARQKCKDAGANTNGNGWAALLTAASVTGKAYATGSAESYCKTNACSATDAEDV